MIPNPCIEVQTSPLDRPSVPAWFARSRHDGPSPGGERAAGGFCASRVRLIRGRFGSYEPIDFLALLVGYAISGERTLSDFFERVAPFETAFMALFGRRCLPPRSSLSRAPFRCRSSLFGSLPRTRASSRRSRRGGPRKPLAASSRRLGRRYLVFD